METYMLDTDISIYTIKRKPPEVRRLFNIHSSELCISSVTLAELCFGAENSSDPGNNLKVVEGFAARLSILKFDHAAARQYGRLRHELLGNPIGPYDMMIAAHARSRGLVLVTNNVTEYKRVPGLRVENWVN
jgi:tRNA(fMet)-specific endonuclease VapC